MVEAMLTAECTYRYTPSVQGPPQVVRAAALRQKLKIEHALSILTPGQPVLALTQ